jgi:hypothetical protein
MDKLGRYGVESSEEEDKYKSRDISAPLFRDGVEPVFWSSDASASGIGLVLFGKFYYLRAEDVPRCLGWSVRALKRSSDGIYVLELLGAVLPLFIASWDEDVKERIRGRSLFAWTDNKSVATTLSKGRSKEKIAGVIMRFAACVLNVLECDLWGLWTPREGNELADAISKLC